MHDLLITHATVLQVSLNAEIRLLNDHALAIQDKRITAIAPSHELAGTPSREIIDATGMVAMPGLINTHAHVPMVLFRGLAEDVTLEKWFNEFMWPLESNLQEEDVYWGMQWGLAEMIEAGVTSVADHYFFMDEAARAVETAGTRAALGWAVFGNQGLPQLDRTVEFCRRWRGAADGRITTWLAPHAPYTCDDDFLRACAVRARRENLGLHIHVSETQEQVNACVRKKGRTPIQLLSELGLLDQPAILAHAVGATAEDLELMKYRSVGIAHAPKTYLKLAMGTAPVVDFYRAGIPVGLATDGAVSNNTLDIFESLRLLALTQKQAQGTPEVMTVNEALWIATRGSARVIGLGDQIGALEPNYLADILLLSMDTTHTQPLHNLAATLVYASRASDVHTVLVNGQVIMRDRQLLTLDKKEIQARMTQAIARLAHRVPASRIQQYAP